MFETKRLYGVIEALHQETCEQGGQAFDHSAAWHEGMKALTELDGLLFHLGGTGAFDQTNAALLQVPPGRTLAGEYLRLLSYIGELNRQVVRGMQLRIEAEQRAGRRNVGKLEDQITQQENVIAVLVSVVKYGQWRSCAHLAQSVRRALNDEEMGTESTTAKTIEDLLDVGLDEPEPETTERLEREGLLPPDALETRIEAYEEALAVALEACVDIARSTGEDSKLAIECAAREAEAGQPARELLGLE